MSVITSATFEQQTEHRPWGSFTILADEADHKVKRIVVQPGQRLSLQRHQHRREHWLIVSGQALVTRNREKLILEPGQAIDIDQGDVHRVQNEAEKELVFIEIQLGSYFGEDDIERFEDDYGRRTGAK